MLVADGFTRPGQDQRIVQSVRYGIPWVQLRDHGASPDVVDVSASVLVRRLRKISPGIVLTLNGHPAMAQRLRIGQHEPAHAVGAEYPNTAGPRGRSTHHLEEVEQARNDGLDYVLFGHVFETASHRGEAPRGLSALREAVEVAGPMPVIAIGGVLPERVPFCREVGAHGGAGLSGIMQAPNLFQAVDAYSRALGSLPSE